MSIAYKSFVSIQNVEFKTFLSGNGNKENIHSVPYVATQEQWQIINVKDPDSEKPIYFGDEIYIKNNHFIHSYLAGNLSGQPLQSQRMSDSNLLKFNIVGFNRQHGEVKITDALHLSMVNSKLAPKVEGSEIQNTVPLFPYKQGNHQSFLIVRI